jgi:hypothetical protein
MQRSEGNGKNRENTKARIKIVIRLFPLDSNLRKHFNIFLSVVLICSTLLFQQGRAIQYGDDAYLQLNFKNCLIVT